MSYVSDREREQFRELLRLAATEDSQRLHPDRGETDATGPREHPSRDDAVTGRTKDAQARITTVRVGRTRPVMVAVTPPTAGSS
jgi:hypothetical protein